MDGQEKTGRRKKHNRSTMPRILNFEAFKGMGARRHQLNHPTETSLPIQPKAEFSKVKTPWQMQQGTWGYHLLKQTKREGPI